MPEAIGRRIQGTFGCLIMRCVCMSNNKRVENPFEGSEGESATCKFKLICFFTFVTLHSVTVIDLSPFKICVLF